MPLRCSDYRDRAEGGPQGAELALAAALEVAPNAAGAFFDGLAQFYPKGYLPWVKATRRKPDLRAARIAAMVQLLRTGHAARPSAAPQ